MNGVIPIICPHCHHEGKVPESFLGKTIRCKTCDAHFPVKAPREEPAPTAPAAPTFVDGVPSLTAVLGEVDDIPLAPLTPDEEAHCRERYEARVLMKKHHGENEADPEIEREHEHERRLQAMERLGLTSKGGGPH